MLSENNVTAPAGEAARGGGLPQPTTLIQTRKPSRGQKLVSYKPPNNTPYNKRPYLRYIRPSISVQNQQSTQPYKPTPRNKGGLFDRSVHVEAT